MSTLKKIAEAAGVSYSTVSRALSGSQSISQDTRKRILKIAERMNYMPNKAAQMLVDKRKGAAAHSTLISVIYGRAVSLTDYYFSTVIKSIIDEASSHGFTVTVSSIAGSYEGVLNLGRLLKDHFTTGFILVGNVDDSVVPALLESSPNTVIVDKPMPNLTSVVNNNERGARDAVTFLIGTGCRRIAHIGGVPGHYFSDAMMQGYRQALSAAGLHFDQSLCAHGEFNTASGARAMREILARGVRPDGVFSNDEMAIGAMKTLKQQGLRIPEDVSVFGFDNLAISEQVEPSLSTVKIDCEYMARTAVQKVIENSLSHEVVPVNIQVPVELIIRESTRKTSG